MPKNIRFIGYAYCKWYLEWEYVHLSSYFPNNARYASLTFVGRGLQIRVFIHSNICPVNYQYAFSKQQDSMLKYHGIKKLWIQGGLILMLCFQLTQQVNLFVVSFQVYHFPKFEPPGWYLAWMVDHARIMGCSSGITGQTMLHWYYCAGLFIVW